MYVSYPYRKGMVLVQWGKAIDPLTEADGFITVHPKIERSRNIKGGAGQISGADTPDTATGRNFTRCQFIGRGNG